MTTRQRFADISPSSAPPTQVVEALLRLHSAGYIMTDRELVVTASTVESATGLKLSCPIENGLSLFAALPGFEVHHHMVDSLLTGGNETITLTFPVQIEAAATPETGATVVQWLTAVGLPRHDEKREIAGVILFLNRRWPADEHDRQMLQQRHETAQLRHRLIQQNLELVAASVELRQLDEMKSRFVSFAAHELRTPLASISGFVEFLLDGELGPLTDEQRECMIIVQRSAQRLLGITSNLLDVTRIATGRLSLVMYPVDLKAAVQEVIEELRPQFELRAQTVVLKVDPDLPQALCDEQRLTQIFANLLGNANKYTPSHGEISVTITRSSEPGFLLVSVHDNGIGIPASEHDQLFDSFYRASNVTTTSTIGSGLGLHIVRSLVELHGGKIWLESEVGLGSTFFFTVPALDAAALDAAIQNTSQDL
jgi:signal transduction histidine kinase